MTNTNYCDYCLKLITSHESPLLARYWFRLDLETRIFISLSHNKANSSTNRPLLGSLEILLSLPRLLRAMVKLHT